MVDISILYKFDYSKIGEYNTYLFDIKETLKRKKYQ